MAKAKKKVEYPYRKSDEKALKEGQRVARAQYYTDVRRAAEGVLDEAIQQGMSPGTRDEDMIIDLISEESGRAVTYFSDAWRIAYLSDSSDAIEDFGDPEEWVSGATGVNDVITRIARAAYEQDLREDIGVLDTGERARAAAMSGRSENRGRPKRKTKRRRR